MSNKIGLHALGLDGFLEQQDQSSGWVDPVLESAGSFAAVAAPVAVGSAALATALYLQETGDSAAISVNDLHQGQIGDCFLIASIGELALNRPASITNMIRANANGTETVTLYTDKNGHVAGFGATVFKAVSVTIDNTFPTYSVNNAASQDVVKGTKEIWPQVLEKAIATLDGGYSAIANGGNPMIAMQELTGHSATFMSPAQLSMQALQSFMAAGDLIVMDTANAALPFNLVGSHAYMFEKLSVVSGQQMVQMGNPWGTAQPALVPFAQLSKAFVEVDIGRVA